MPTVKKYPNQKLITIHRATFDKDQQYFRVNINVMYNAMKILSGRNAPSFQLWCYIASNMDNWTFALSPEAVEEQIGMKRDAYNSAVNKLIDKGFLVLREKNTIYDFYEMPQKKDEEGKEG